MKSIIYYFLVINLLASFILEAKDIKKEACEISKKTHDLSPLGIYLIDKIEIGKISVLPPAATHKTGYVLTHNGATWAVLEKDISYLKNWKKGERVILTDDPSYKKKLSPPRLLLINADQRSAVRIDCTFCGSREKLFITRISDLGDEIELIDGSLWKIHSQLDREQALKWEILKDYIIIGCDFTALKENRSGYILINPKNYSGIDLINNCYIGTSKICADLQP